MKNIYKLKNSKPWIETIISETIYQLKLSICKSYDIALFEHNETVIKELQPHINQIRRTFYYYDRSRDIQFYKPL